ncbi:MAG TPA: hypothetical protein VE573_07110 [Nitrososphaeraceae archaeon]|nr:hypothetical protein [Nitrososphaeraceae archaeon]
MTTLSLIVPSKIAIAQQQGNETNMIPMGKMVQNMTEEQLSKQIMQTTMDEIKKDNPMHADLIDKIPSMNLEETVKNLLVLEDIEQVLKTHIQDLIEGNQTNG